MDSARTMTARALAHAMLAGSRHEEALAARMAVCLDQRPPWLVGLAQAMARVPGEVWQRLDVATLSERVEAHEGFAKAWAGKTRPEARRWLLRSPDQLAPAPTGLERPHWPTVGALALGLGMTPAGLWRLTLPADWQRRRPLAQQHYRQAPVPKRGEGAGWRLLEVPAPHLRAVQRRLLTQLLNGLPPHEAAFGYARGRSVVQHAALHAGQGRVLRFDLSDFFSTVSAARIHALFKTLGYSTAVARSLAALCTTSAPEAWLSAEPRLSWPQKQRLRDAHLPEGAPTSPALANLCAFGLDARLSGLAGSFGARYSRYADDLVISGPASLPLRAISALVAAIAADEGFVIHPRKTRSLGMAQRQSVCGIVVNQRPNLPRDEFDRLKATLHRCVVDGPAGQNREGHADWQAHLQGRVAWAAQLNPGKAKKLRLLLDRVDWSR
ncbi:reverse transcriptase family protein [Roseateles sp. NT4]|uniref:reverse transcriptase family protein n=1 Tax=Roseateles sp. NT4 TaxID=3453715 RepID=UPI003EE86545